METQAIFEENGQEVRIQDIAEASKCALQDDRVLAELLRLTPKVGAGGAPARAILPYRESGETSAASPSGATVWAATGGLFGTGKVYVQPFRAIIGSRTAVSSDAKANWRDIRSGIAVGSTTLSQTLTVANDSGGGARFDLIYAKVLVDEDTTSESRKVKSPASLVVGTQTLVTRRGTVVSVHILKGTEGSATKPTIPADLSTATNDYYIPLAYVRVPAGFTAATALGADDIWELFPTAPLAESSGATTVRPANQSHEDGGTVETNAAWTTAGVRPSAHMPASMVGGEQLLIALDLTTGARSHNSGDVIDDSRDWSNRMFVYHVTAIGAGSTPYFPWEQSAAAPFVGAAPTTLTSDYTSGMGQSMAAPKRAAYVTATMLTNLAPSSTVELNVDADGKLVLGTTNAPNAKVFIWLMASAPFSNK